MKYTKEEVQGKLAALTGNDFELVAKQERKLGNTNAMLSFDERFQVRLAARALDMNVHDLKELPLREYSQIINWTGNFLFRDSDAEDSEN